MEGVYFFDTYAVVETIEGKKAYTGYKGSNAIITKLNLFEICQFLYRKGFSEEEVDAALSEYGSCVVDYSTQLIKEAVRMKLKNRKLSPADCVGYQVAQEYGVKFLTGDKEFMGMPGVEFVK